MKTKKRRLFESSRQEKRIRESAGDMVTHYRAPGSPLSAKATKQLADLAAMPDEAIDYSDIPPLTEDFWKNAVRNPYYKPIKQQVTVRLDSDVVAWAKRDGRGYQTRINAALRKAMIAEIKKQQAEATHKKAS
jgi:uncharacterized protein (DUF4415 family)